MALKLSDLNDEFLDLEPAPGPKPISLSEIDPEAIDGLIEPEAPPAPEPPSKPAYGPAAYLKDAGLAAAGQLVSGTAAIPRAIESQARQVMRSSLSQGGRPGLMRVLGVDTTGIDKATTDQEREAAVERALAEIPRIGAFENWAKWGEAKEKDIKAGMSTQGKTAMEKPTFEGNLLRGEFSIGDDATLAGAGLQIAGVLGSFLPTIAATLLTRRAGVGATVGGGMAGGEALRETEQFVGAQSDEALYKNSPLFRHMVDAGESPERARALTVNKAGEAAALYQGLVAGLGDQFTGKLILGAFDNLLARSGSRAVRGAAAGGVGALEEGFQETGEGIASDIGIQRTVQNKEIGEGSAENFALGAAGGGIVGGAKGLMSDSPGQAVGRALREDVNATYLPRDQIDATVRAGLDPTPNAAPIPRGPITRALSVAMGDLPATMQPDQYDDTGLASVAPPAAPEAAPEAAPIVTPTVGPEAPAPTPEPAPQVQAQAEPPGAPDQPDLTLAGVQATEPGAERKPDESPQNRVSGLEVIEAPVADLQLSRDVPQFKEGANEQGVVEPLGGRFDRRGVAPIQVWERLDGRREVISGRHRLDLARRSGETTIPAQIHREADGFTVEQARSLDAELNIRDGQGKAIDYVDYFQAQGITEEQAKQEGLVARNPGRRAFALATSGGEALIAQVRAGGISDTDAERITLAAPGNEALQAVAIDQMVNKGSGVNRAVGTMQAVQALAGGGEAQPETLDLFGFDDSRMREAERMGTIAAKRQTELSRDILAISGASKRPEVAKRYGVDVKDPEALKAKLAELKQQRTAWGSWPTNPELVAQVRAEMQGEAAPPAPKPRAKPKTTSPPVPAATETPAPATTQEPAKTDTEKREPIVIKRDADQTLFWDRRHLGTAQPAELRVMSDGSYTGSGFMGMTGGKAPTREAAFAKLIDWMIQQEPDKKQPNGKKEYRRWREAIDWLRAERDAASMEPETPEPTPLELTGQTPEEVAAEEARKRQEQEQARDEERKAKADAQVDDFVLTGSDRPVDEAEARGQGNLFDAPTPKKEDAPAPSLPKFEELDGFRVGERVRYKAAGESTRGDMPVFDAIIVELYTTGMTKKARITPIGDDEELGRDFSTGLGRLFKIQAEPTQEPQEEPAPGPRHDQAEPIPTPSLADLEFVKLGVKSPDTGKIPEDARGRIAVRFNPGDGTITVGNLVNRSQAYGEDTETPWETSDGQRFSRLPEAKRHEYETQVLLYLRREGYLADAPEAEQGAAPDAPAERVETKAAETEPTPQRSDAAAVLRKLVADGKLAKIKYSKPGGTMVEANIVSVASRPVVVAMVNGVPIPFYVSTGSGGKKSVPAGRWYPFFGFGPNRGWFNKTSAPEINRYYDVPELREMAETLNAEVGDVRGDPDLAESEETDNRIEKAINLMLPFEPVDYGYWVQLSQNVTDIKRMIGKGEPEVSPDSILPDPDDLGAMFDDLVGAEFEGEPEATPAAKGPTDKEEAAQLRRDARDLRKRAAEVNKESKGRASRNLVDINPDGSYVPVPGRAAQEYRELLDRAELLEKRADALDPRVKREPSNPRLTIRAIKTKPAEGGSQNGLIVTNIPQRTLDALGWTGVWFMPGEVQTVYAQKGPIPSQLNDEVIFEGKIGGGGTQLIDAVNARLPKKERAAGAKTAMAKSAASNLTAGAKEAMEGLVALFDPGKGTLGSGPVFNEETYAKARPHFIAASRHFAQAGQDARALIRDIMRDLIKMLREQFGLSQDGVQAMKPYVVRFAEEVREGVIDLGGETDAQSSATGTQGNRGAAGDSGAANQGTAGDGRPDAGRAPGLDGRGPADAGSEPTNGRGVSGDRAPAAGKRGGARVSRSGRFGGGSGSTAGRGNGGRGGKAGGAGLASGAEGATPAAGSPGAGPERTRDLAKAAKVKPVLADLENIRESLPQLLPVQQEDVEFIEKRYAAGGRGVVVTNGTGTGKAQPLDSLVLTTDGWRRMGELSVGDEVISVDGKPTKITGVYPQGEKPIYLVTFSDGASVECCNEHLWLTQTLYERRKSSGHKMLPCSIPKVRSLEEISASIDAQHFIPMVQPVEAGISAPDVIPPYTMGVLLGDGCFRGGSVTFTCPDIEIADRVHNDLSDGFAVRSINVAGDRCATFRISDSAGLPSVTPSAFRASRIKAELKKFDLWGKFSYEKHIPGDYLVASLEGRIALLNGLLDTDGWCDKRTGSPYYCTSSEMLADDVTALVRSLGGIATRSTKITASGRPGYTLCINLPRGIAPFSLPRKAEIYRPNTKYPPRRKIVDVKYVGDKQAQCISVAHESRLYVTNDYVVTHNTFTALGAIVRQIRNGKPNVIITAPNIAVIDAWVKTARDHFGIDIHRLRDTKDAGEDGQVVITTYENFYQNEALPRRAWDMVVHDEAHKLAENQAGNATGRLDMSRALTGHPRGAYFYASMMERELVDSIDSMNKALKSGFLDAEEMRGLTRQINEAVREWETRRKAHEENRAALWAGKSVLRLDLSATPWAYEKSIDASEGFLFDYGPEPKRGGYNTPDARGAFMMQHFGYRMRYGKLTEPDANVDRGVMQRQFNQWLRKQGALRGRALEVEHDYSREFVAVSDLIGNQIDRGMEIIREAARDKDNPLQEGYQAYLGLIEERFDYHERIRLLEAIKAPYAVERARQHLALGRKVIIYHSRIKGGATHPFRMSYAPEMGQMEMKPAQRAIQQFEEQHPDLYNLDLGKLRRPLDLFAEAFSGEVVFYNGRVPGTAKRAAPGLFNESDQHNVIVVQDDAGREGISLHDTTGKHPRALINIGLPLKPTQATQIEGRAYRVGQASDAIFEYFNTGTNFERWTFAETIAARASAAENLAMGDAARRLRDSFVDAFESPTLEPASPGQGKGGKEADAASYSALSPFREAVTHYWGVAKNTKRRDNREGQDYFATPEPVGFKMVEWAEMRPNETALEPSAGHGAIARYFPESVNAVFVEPSSELLSRLALRAQGKMRQQDFESLDIGANKFDTIVMNPPYGQAGATARDHLQKAMDHLRNGGRIVALIPEGSDSVNKKFDALLYGADGGATSKPEDDTQKIRGLIREAEHNGDGERASKLRRRLAQLTNFHVRADIGLPRVTFERAGTQVKTRVLIIDRLDGQDASLPRRGRIDIDAESVAELFDRLEEMGVPERPPVQLEPAAVLAGAGIKVDFGEEHGAFYVTGKTYDHREEFRPVYKKHNGVWVSARKAWMTTTDPSEDLAKVLMGLPVDDLPADGPTEGATATPPVPVSASTTEALSLAGLKVAHGRTPKGTEKWDVTGTGTRAHKDMLRNLGGKWYGPGKSWTFWGGDPSEAIAAELRADSVNDPGTWFSRSGRPGMTPAKIETAVASVIAEWKGRARVVIVRSPQDSRVPEALRQSDAEHLARGSGDAAGAYYGGTVYLFSDGIESPAHAIETLAHEMLVHHGLRGAFGKALEPILESLAHTRRADVARKAAEYGLDMGKRAERLLAAEELLAEMGQTQPSAGFVRRAVAAIRAWLRRHGFDLKLSDSEIIVNFLLPARQFVESGRRAGADADEGSAQGSGGGVRFARRQPSGNPTLDEARQRIGQAPPATLRQRLSGVLGSVFDAISTNRAEHLDVLRQGTLDQFYGILRRERQTVGNLPREQSAYVAARLANGISSVMRAVLLHGAPRWAANTQHLERIPGTRGLLDILSDVGEDLDDWLGWMAGNRAARLLREGRENNLTEDHIQALQSLGTPERIERFRRAAREFAAFKRAVLDVAEQAGLIDPESRAVWDNADWIPFYRNMAGAEADRTIGPRGKRGLANQSSGIRTLRGGESETNDLLENIMMNFHHLLDASLKNNALQKAVGIGGDFVERLPQQFQQRLIPNSEVKRMLRAQGTPEDVLDLFPPEVFAGISRMWSFATPSEPNVIRVMEGGRPVYYRVTDPLLLRAVTSFERFDFPGLKTARAFRRVLTASVTATPAFMLRNFLRDTLSTQIIAEDRPGIASAFRGAARTWRETGYAEQMLFAGASFAAGYIEGTDPEAVARSVRRSLRARGLSAAAVDGYMASIVDLVGSGWDQYRRINEALENANREAVFERIIRSGGSATAAAFEAKDLMDFSLRGAWTGYQILADVIPFFNARVQGLYRLGRTNPRALAVRGALLLILPSVLLAIANLDNDDYKELPDWDKDTYWHFWIGKEHFRIPKPFELGLAFGTMPERAVHALAGNISAKKLLQRFAWGVTETLNLAGPITSAFGIQALAPIAEVASNWDAFRGQEIEHLGDEKVSPHLRYSGSTSDFARVLLGATAPVTDLIGLSPKRFEHLVEGYLGSVGGLALSILDWGTRLATGAPEQPTWRVDEIPLLNVLYRGSGQNPPKYTQYIEDVYEGARAYEKVRGDFNKLKRDGKDEAAAALLERNAERLDALQPLHAASKALRKASKATDAIYRDAEMSPVEKRAELDAIMRERNELARDAVRLGLDAR